MHLRQASQFDTSLIPFIEREMEDMAYHLENENIHFTDANDGNCASFVSDHDENDCQRLSEKDFQTIDHEHFSEVTSFQDLNSRTNEIEELNLIDNSSTSLCTNEQDNKEPNKDFEDCRIADKDAFKESSSAGEFKSNPPFRRGVQLIRLQAASAQSKEQPSQVECDVDLQKDNITSTASEVSQGDIFKNEVDEVTETQVVVYSEPEYQFLTPKVPDVLQKQIYVSQNSEGNFQLGDPIFQALMESENMNIEDTPTSNYAPIVISSVTGSDFVSPKPNQNSSQSMPVVKTPMWLVTPKNSRITNSASDDSTRVNSSSSFQSVCELSESMPSEYQNSTHASDSEIPDAQQMQRFLTADNQVVYGYKDSKGEFHFFCQALNDRESHNEKERKRRSRVSEACSTLRKLVPGLNDKTDKATVFEHAAAYLQFLREKFASQFDQSYCEKYFQVQS